MNYSFTILILAVVLLANGYAGHNNTAAKDRLNEKIKKEFWQILAITSLPGHKDYNETLYDIFEGLGRQIPEFPQGFELLILDCLNGYAAYSKEHFGYEPNFLTPLLPAPKYKQLGKIEGSDRDNINLALWKLADAYVNLFKEEGEDKVIYVVPIAIASRPKTTSSTIILGVLGKRAESWDQLTGIAGIAL